VRGNNKMRKKPDNTR